MRTIEDNFTDDLDEDDVPEDAGSAHPSNPATIPQAPPDMVTVQLGKDERLNLSIAMTLLMDEVKEEKKLASKHSKRAKELQDEIDGMAIAVRTGVKEVPNTAQQDLLRQPVGGQAAAEAFGDLAKKAEAAQAAAEAEAAPEWRPEHHADTCPAKQGPLHGCACGWNKGHGGPVAEEPFETPPEELERQAGRKPRGKKVA